MADLTDYRGHYYTGGFSFSWTPGFTGASAIDLGTTERGFGISMPIQTIPIKEDRYVDTTVDEILMGSEKAMVTITSLNMFVSTVDLLRYALSFASATAYTTGAFAAPSATIIGVHESTFGNDILDAAGPLVCTCVSGHADLVGKALTFPLAFPLESESVLLTARGISIPFSFSCWLDRSVTSPDTTFMSAWTEVG